MFSKICSIFLLFIMYSFLGWLMEVGLILVEKHKFVNRGFLIGPYCPIYGWGCLTMIILLTKYQSDPIVLFIMAILICSILEYATSYVMEKIFHARWWDYSNKKYNINGRICLETMIPFGILGCIVIYFINPIFTSFLLKIPTTILKIVSIVLFIIFLVDNILSMNIISKFKNTMNTVEKDSTEEITKKVKEAFRQKGLLYQRLMNAYPNIKNHKEYLLELQEKINKDISKFNNKIEKYKKNK